VSQVGRPKTKKRASHPLRGEVTANQWAEAWVRESERGSQDAHSQVIPPGKPGRQAAPGMEKGQARGEVMPEGHRSASQRVGVGIPWVMPRAVALQRWV
jgi:hypothetical protein